MILNDKRLIDEGLVFALEHHLEVLMLNRSGLDACCDNFAVLAERVRWAVIRLTLMRKMIRLARFMKRNLSYDIDAENRADIIAKVLQGRWEVARPMLKKSAQSMLLESRKFERQCSDSNQSHQAQMTELITAVHQLSSKVETVSDKVDHLESRLASQTS
eukprot:gnl/TRDRNA2_/TRDRNA2_152778_c2_seq1.p1 gnl/TRDRNA2_/TRDRNA2_152778_c2~~gnl/TRDRNA2_/TRDRNA2_152778_c2_seq1.p1  ORF type:complete len:188 (-),score=11.63 gnl/TRDRNA2_/TRDRNA2_152778_c2_seq1:160-639(-)